MSKKSLDKYRGKWIAIDPLKGLIFSNSNITHLIQGLQKEYDLQKDNIILDYVPSPLDLLNQTFGGS
jgi:hypothetical protein